MTTLNTEYSTRYNQYLLTIAEALEKHLKDLFSGHKRIDRIVSRAKGIDRFIQKAAKLEGGKAKYSDPLLQIQDQIGARIITFYTADLSGISEIIKNYFRPIEIQKIVHFIYEQSLWNIVAKGRLQIFIGSYRN